MSESLRGSLFNEGYVYQFAARASALAFLSASVWITPTVSYSNRAMMTEAIARAIESREHILATGPSEQAESAGRPRSFDAALDNGVGAFSLGVAP